MQSIDESASARAYAAEMEQSQGEDEACTNTDQAETCTNTDQTQARKPCYDEDTESPKEIVVIDDATPDSPPRPPKRKRTVDEKVEGKKLEQKSKLKRYKAKCILASKLNCKRKEVVDELSEVMTKCLIKRADEVWGMVLQDMIDDGFDAKALKLLIEHYNGEFDVGMNVVFPDDIDVD
jgi:hypothetical protein